MNTRNRFDHDSDAATTRLAESSVAAIDACACGMFHLHIGAMTLRLAPCAAAELLRALSQAVAAHSQHFDAEQALTEPAAALLPRRCDA